MNILAHFWISYGHLHKPDSCTWLHEVKQHESPPNLPWKLTHGEGWRSWTCFPSNSWGRGWGTARTHPATSRLEMIKSLSSRDSRISNQATRSQTGERPEKGASALRCPKATGTNYNHHRDGAFISSDESLISLCWFLCDQLGLRSLNGVRLILPQISFCVLFLFSLGYKRWHLPGFS